MTKPDQPPRSAVLHRTTRHVPKKAVGGKGSYLHLEDGQKVLDSTCGAAVSCLGHGNEEAAEDLAELMVDSTGGKLSKLLVINSGSEAVEAAIKLARQYFLELPTPQPQRTRFIARKPSYHGITLGALGVGGHTIRRDPFAPLLAENTSHVSPCFEYRGKQDKETDEDYVARLAAELDAEFQKVGPETVCAFVAETVAGASLGCVPAVPGYFPAMKAVCEKHGALFILDEVMTGIGRCGTLHAWEQEGVVPDIQTMGKGLGGGYAPVSGVLIGENVVQALDKGSGAFRHGQTYQGHPIACAAALAVQRIIQRDNLLQNVRDMGGYLGKQLKAKLEGHPNVGDVRGRGLFWGIEFVQDKKTKEPFPTKAGIGTIIQETALKPEYSISLLPGVGTVEGNRGDVVIIAPPYNVSREEVDIIANTTERVVEDVFRNLLSGA